MLDLLLDEETLYAEMIRAILVNKTIGVYDGAYNVVKLAMGLKEKE